MGTNYMEVALKVDKEKRKEKWQLSSKVLVNMYRF